MNLSPLKFDNPSLNHNYGINLIPRSLEYTTMVNTNLSTNELKEKISTLNVYNFFLFDVLLLYFFVSSRADMNYVREGYLPSQS